MVKNPPANAGDMGLIPGLGGSHMPCGAAKKKKSLDFPGDAVDKNLPANAGDMGLIPGLGGFHLPQSN